MRFPIQLGRLPFKLQLAMNKASSFTRLDRQDGSGIAVKSFPPNTYTHDGGKVYKLAVIVRSECMYVCTSVFSQAEQLQVGEVAQAIGHLSGDIIAEQL